MKSIKKPFSFFLITAVLVSGLPCFLPGDADRNRRVDLQDAILLVKVFADSAQSPASFHSCTSKLFSALKSAAGLKPSIQKETAKAAGQLLFDTAFTCLSSTQLFLQDAASGWMPAPETESFASVDLFSNHPPPEQTA